MAKPWYFQMMGAEIGPLTSAELMERVKLGQVQPDTLVRSGQDGKWVPADRWKGLLPAKEDKPEPQTPTHAKETPAAKPAPAKTEAASVASTLSAGLVNEEDDPLYHLKGEAAPTGPVPFTHPDEYDFFQFVGFRHAISHPLYDAMVIYSHQKQLTVTQITRQAIASFIGRPELGHDKPPVAEPATAEPVEAPPESNAATK
jgi:hypothetical protein